jgi:hypothetical protein
MKAGREIGRVKWFGRPKKNRRQSPRSCPGTSATACVIGIKQGPLRLETLSLSAQEVRGRRTGTKDCGGSVARLS